ncbi:DUF262 domain-containing protein [Winogradskyella sp.]|uniref:DUF262 domain-containing protein n=1 Tax=Winogradskyella sp. TaxID=1883156 RepID=UPI0026126CA1|nr:DUF262 domain-containing protein [Winogradskyella sp.]
MYKIYPINELGKQTVSKIYDNRNRIDFMPYYQRFGGIWSPEKKKLLIDTIINEFDIPKFYFNYFVEQDNPLNINDKIYAVIDGKQRLQAIFDFLDNKYKLDKSCKIINDNISLNNYDFERLNLDYPTTAKKILNYVLDVVFIVTDEDSRLEEMFLRLNGGIALTNAEKRNAINSFLNREIRQIIIQNPFFTHKVRFKNPRYQHNDLLTKLLFVEYKGLLINLGNKELENFIREFSKENQDSIGLIQRTKHMLVKFNEVFEEKDMLLKGKGVIPVYYQFLKEYFGRDSNLLKYFLSEFEDLRNENRKSEDQNVMLQEFDFFNQQGVHREKSLNFRLRVLNLFFSYFEENQTLNGALDRIEDEDDSFGNFDDY